MTLIRLTALATIVCLAAWGQETGRLEGSVTDPQGAAIPVAQVRVTNVATGQTLSTTTDERGAWVLPFMVSATYRATISKDGFKSATVENVKVDAGVPATVNVKLELGQVTETVEVTAGAETLQTASATLATTLTGRQINELPYVSRNALDLIVSQASTVTMTTTRESRVAGLPESTINITLDGVNIQDNYLKNSDGFFTAIQPRSDAIEEVSISTAGAGADALQEGATQIRFVTRSGTNDYHGGVFWQHRNTAFNANYYFNNQAGLPRDRVILNQGGGRLGGPIKRNKAFFFVHYEMFRFPQTSNASRTILTDDARNGVFVYGDSTGRIQRVNLYQIMAQRNASMPAGVRAFATTPDPLVLATLNDIDKLTLAAGVRRTRVTNPNLSANDYSRLDYNFQAPGGNNRNFPTAKLDWNVTEKHHLEFVYNYQSNYRVPDGLNSILPIYPGTGGVLGNDTVLGQRGIKFSGVGAVRSVLTQRLTSEVRFGLTGGSTLFRHNLTPAMFDRWRGYSMSLGYVSNAHVTSTTSRRNSPVKQLNLNLSYLRSSHLFNFGGSYTDIRTWQQETGTQIVPGVTFGVAANDPVNFGNTAMFTTDFFPNSTPGQRNNARDLYALLTGRVSQISRSVALGETTKQFGNFPTVDRAQQREYGIFLQDRWRLTPNLTVNLGARYENQLPLRTTNGVYTRVGLEGLYGISGVGNLFKPGTLTGQVPVYLAVDPDTQGYPPSRFVSPSFGIAWTLPKTGPMRWLLGSRSVLRAGYAIAINRGGLASIIDDTWGSNQGRTRSATVTPANFPAEFGLPGGVLFRDPTLPARVIPTQPTYPLAASAGNSMYDYDPNLKNWYIPSWNVSLQRELMRGTVLDVRYVGNRGKRLWGSVNLNEVNIRENGFLDEFRIAQENLRITRAAQAPGATPSIDFGNRGLPGQRPIPMISTAFGTTSDQTSALLIERGEVGDLASNISGNQQRMDRLAGAGYPRNLFVVNPTINASANLTTNGFPTRYDAFQAELTRRMTHGLLTQASYTWSHTFTTAVATLRNLAGEQVPSDSDLRHALKMNWIFELPFGAKRRFFNSVSNGVARRAIEGWEIAGVARVQSGNRISLTSGRNTFNGSDSNVVLYNMTAADLQSMIRIRKESVAQPDGTFRGVVYWLPQDIIDNSLAAFELNGRTVDRSKPYIGPPTTAGQYGFRTYLKGPWQQKWDLSVVKITRLREQQSIEFRAQLLNVFNVTNFFPGGGGVNSTAFGQSTSAYRDISNTNDPGGRIIEWVLRYNF